jgi:predicted CXXCH cytochrome family protein
MTSRVAVGCVALLVFLSAAAIARSQQNPYRLKEPDQKKLCLQCHTDFEQKLRSRYVHTPVRSGECSSCHDAHVSSHGKLLSADPREICIQCHAEVIPAKARSIHKVAADGDCRKCHDPHASNNPANLLAIGSELCFTCHAGLGDAIRHAKFKHTPVEQGCDTCHVPHASESSERLLRSDGPGMCVTCHKADTAAFRAAHMSYPVQTASCSSCHDPHGSSQPALLLSNVHQPLGSRSCTQCHANPESATPFATKRQGYELCRGCHTEAVNSMLAKKQLHWPLADRTGCANCHSPHASKHGKLVKSETPELCGNCHADTLQRIGGVAAKHAPVEGGSCAACHSPHGSDTVNLLGQASIVQTCTTCHDYSTHSAHPIGDKAVDPRNRNLRVDCLSCHRGHGTPFKYMLLTETNVELCTRCHTNVVR